MQPMPDIAALLKIAQSPAGQKLLAMLMTQSAGDLDAVKTAAASGNLEAAKKQLGSLLTSREAQELLKQLEKQI